MSPFICTNIVLGRCLTIPANMALWCASFASSLGACRLAGCTLLAISFLLGGREFVLAFEPKFEFKLLDPGFELLVFNEQLAAPLPLSIQLKIETTKSLCVITACKDKRAK